MKIILSLKYLLCILFVARGMTFSQTIPQKFFDALIYDKAEITDYVNKDELKKSNRLGITYTSVKNKFMLGYDLPDEIKEGIRSGKYKYEVKEQSLADSYSQVTFSVPDANFSKVYYFNNGFVSNSTYFTKGWQKKESKYFNFNIEEPKYFNEYCIKRLDDFVDMIADTLGYTISEKRILEKEKLGYIFCADEKGVEKITGFNAKGLAMLGTDEVVTSYQTHFHEVAHLLINYKLKTLGLYTLPFFMEGFAVTVGGRGGMAPRVVTDLGFYLQKTGELTYNSIFTFDQFRSMDGSMTYPVSGLYNSFLLSELGGEKYLELYKKVNGDLEYVKGLKNDFIIQPENKYADFLKKYEEDTIFFIDSRDTLGQNSQFLPFAFKNNFVKFFVFRNRQFGPENDKYVKGYISRKAKELVDQNFPNGQYAIFCDSSFINVFNFYNDELIFSYNYNLSANPVLIPVVKRECVFFLRESLFNNTFKEGFHWIR